MLPQRHFGSGKHMQCSASIKPPWVLIIHMTSILFLSDLEGKQEFFELCHFYF